jgi:hypothetical protein
LPREAARRTARDPLSTTVTHRPTPAHRARAALRGGVRWLNPSLGAADPDAMDQPRLCIASHAADSDYAPTSRTLLWKLGYALLPPEEAHQPALRVVREDRLDEVDTNVPIILLTRGRTPRARDPRVAGALHRPAKLHELYRLIQAALEEQPRTVPRVATSLRATGTADTKTWRFEVRSLSENGCLVAGPALPSQGTALELDIELPWGHRVASPAVAAYEQGEQLGLVFHGITLGARKKMARAVMELLKRV